MVEAGAGGAAWKDCRVGTARKGGQGRCRQRLRKSFVAYPVIDTVKMANKKTMLLDYLSLILYLSLVLWYCVTKFDAYRTRPASTRTDIVSLGHDFSDVNYLKYEDTEKAASRIDERYTFGSRALTWADLQVELFAVVGGNESPPGTVEIAAFTRHHETSPDLHKPPEFCGPGSDQVKVMNVHNGDSTCPLFKQHPTGDRKYSDCMRIPLCGGYETSQEEVFEQCSPGFTLHTQGTSFLVKYSTTGDAYIAFYSPDAVREVCLFREFVS